MGDTAFTEVACRFAERLRTVERTEVVQRYRIALNQFLRHLFNEEIDHLLGTGDRYLELQRKAHDKLKKKPFDDETAMEYLRAGKAVCLAADKRVVVLASIGGNALSRFVNANYGTGEDEVNLPIADQYLCAFSAGYIGFTDRLPATFKGWLLASEDDVRAAIARSAQPKEAEHAPR